MEELHRQQVADLEQRARWLEEQAREARSQLAAVEQGRVMRIVAAIWQTMTGRQGDKVMFDS